MRRLLLGPMAVCTLAACLLLAPFVHADDPSFAGTWKVSVLDATTEVQAWILKVDKAATKVEVLSGFKNLGKAKPSEVKGDSKSLRMRLTLSPGNPQAQPTIFSLVAYPVKGKGDDLIGSLRLGLSNFVRIKMKKTTDEEIDPNNSETNLPGSGDFKEAVQTKNKDDRIKMMKDVLKDHEGKAITYLTSQLLIGEMVALKAKAEAFEEPARIYVKQAEPFGHEITVGANLTMGQMLSAYEPTQALGLTYSQKATKLLTEDDPKGLQLAVYLNEAFVLDKAKKADDVKAVASRLDKIADGIIADNTKDKKADVFGPTQLVASLLSNSAVVAVKEIGVKYAERLPKMIKDDDVIDKKLTAYSMLQNALEGVGKKDEAKKAEAAFNALGLKEAQRLADAITDDDPAPKKLGLWNQLREWQTRSGKTDEAKKVTAKIDKLEGDLDKEYEKKNISFDLEKFPGREGKSQRIVLVELFTGAQCPPCVSADIAFDANRKTFKPSDAVFLQYHLHIPLSDPLTSPGSEARSAFYDKDIPGTPATFVDGKVTEGLGGLQNHGKDRYEKLRALIEKGLKVPEGGKIKLQASRKGDKIEMSAETTGFAEATAKTKLRFALVEDVVRYVGGNRQRLHHHVVRALPGGSDGFAVDKKGSTHKASIDLGDLRKELQKYLTTYPSKMPPEEQVRATSLLSIRPMEMKNLKVVAFVQDEDSKKVHQAAQVTVPEGEAAAPEK